MDCFYVAVERARDKRLHGKPCAVVQYPTGQRGRPDLRPDDDRWRTGGVMGGIIAVSYEARAKGVTRQMSGHEAKKVCPEIILVQVPTAFGKADLQIYKDAGDAVVELLAQRCDATEKRSVDEVAIDISSEAQRLLSTVDFATLRARAQRATHLADSALSKAAANVTRSEARQGHQKQQARNVSELADGWEGVFQRFGPTDLTVQRLIAGAVVVSDLRAEVESMLGFTCSGGVATNKILAKLGCGLHKPNQQTLLLPHAAPVLLKDLPLDRLPGLGGDFGQSVKTRFEVETAGQLLQVSRMEVLKHFPQRGEWLLALVAGEDAAAEAVKDRQLVKSLSNGKTFFGEKRLGSLAEVDYWLGELAGELHRRYQKQVEKHQRVPTTLGVSLSMERKASGAKEHLTRQQSISLGSSGSVELILTAAKALVRRAGHVSDVVVLGLCLSNMVSLEASGSLTKCFGKSNAENTGEKPDKSKVKPKVQDPDQENLLKASFARAAKREVEPMGRMDQEVDEGVLAELPLNIQEEIRKQMGLGKEPRAKKLCAEIVEIDA